MGCFTIFCRITGIALEVSVGFEDKDLQDKSHPYYKCNKMKINSDNDKKYSHLNEVRVVLQDSTISELGHHDGYGRVYMSNSNNIYQCSDEHNATIESPYGIAISNSAYILMKDDIRFQKLINNNLFQVLEYYSFSLSESPFKDVYNAQCVSISYEDISSKVLWAYTDPQLIEKIDEPLLGKTMILGNYRKLDGKKSKILYQQLINKFLLESDNH
jgi:hypothetical protein